MKRQRVVAIHYQVKCRVYQDGVDPNWNFEKIAEHACVFGSENAEHGHAHESENAQWHVCE